MDISLCIKEDCNKKRSCYRYHEHHACNIDTQSFIAGQAENCNLYIKYDYIPTNKMAEVREKQKEIALAKTPNIKRRKAVYVDDKLFKTMKEASKFLGCSISTVTNARKNGTLIKGHKITLQQ